MEMIRDDPIIRCMEATGWPPYMRQTRISDYPDDDDQEEPQAISPLDKGVLSLIHFDKAQAITRAELCFLTGLSDRDVRRCIERLRKTYIIINDQDGRGYYRSYDADVVKRAYRQEMARAMATLRRLKPMRRMLIVWGYDV